MVFAPKQTMVKKWLEQKQVFKNIQTNGFLFHIFFLNVNSLLFNQCLASRGGPNDRQAPPKSHGKHCPGHRLDSRPERSASDPPPARGPQRAAKTSTAPRDRQRVRSRAPAARRGRTRRPRQTAPPTPAENSDFGFPSRRFLSPGV